MNFGGTPVFVYFNQKKEMAYETNTFAFERQAIVRKTNLFEVSQISYFLSLDHLFHLLSKLSEIPLLFLAREIKPPKVFDSLGIAHF